LSIVSNASPILNLAAIGEIALLESLFEVENSGWFLGG